MGNSRKLFPGIISIFAIFLPEWAWAHPGPAHVHGWQGDWSYLFDESDYLGAMIIASLLVFLIAVRGLRSDA